MLLTFFVSPIVRRQLRAKAERNAETQSFLVEALSGIQTVKAQNMELKTRWKWQEKYARYVSDGFKTVLTSTTAGSASGFLNKLSGLLVLWVGAYLVLEGKPDIGWTDCLPNYFGLRHAATASPDAAMAELPGNCAVA